jgi:hypothetical protein
MIEITMSSGRSYQLPFDTIKAFQDAATRPWYPVSETEVINVAFVASIKVVTSDGMQTKGKRKERA